MTIEVRNLIPSGRQIGQQISRAAFHSAESRVIETIMSISLLSPRRESGWGLGKCLLTATLAHFRQVRIQTVAAAVRTDNVGSWKNFFDDGFRWMSWGQAF